MRRYKTYKKTKKGFTLLEILLAMAILAIVTAGLLTMFGNGYRDIGAAGKKSISHFTAQNEIESNLSDASIVSANASTMDTEINLNISGNPYIIKGRQVDVIYTYGSKTKILSSFTTK